MPLNGPARHNVVFVLGPPGSGKGTQCAKIKEAMIAAGDVQGFLIDGFPRNRDNLDGWKREMDEKVKVHFVLYLSAPLDMCVGRCLNRAEGRVDDNEQSLQKRIVTYNEQTLPIIDHYKTEGIVREISAISEPDEVFKSVASVFEEAGFEPQAASTQVV